MSANNHNLLKTIRDEISKLSKELNEINILHEAMYMTLSGYSKEIVDMDDKSLDGVPLRIANSMLKEFKKKRKLYSMSEAKKVVDMLKKFDIEFNDRKTAPSILLILTLDYLLNIVEHHRTKLLFGHYREDVKMMYFSINENSTYSKHLDEHLKIIEKFERIV
jgi:uncharacterized protein YjaZ